MRVRPDVTLSSQVRLDLDAHIHQLSVGGMKVEVGAPLELGTAHRFSLNLDGEKLEVEGTVRSSHQAPGSDPPTYLLGVEFLSLSDSERQLIARFVVDKLSTES